MDGRPLVAPQMPALQVMQRDSDFEWCATRLKALADPGRLRIVDLLLEGAKTVSELANELDTALVNVSHHLRVLREANLLQARRRGKFVVYSVHPEVAARATVENERSLDLGCCRLDLAANQNLNHSA